MRLSGRLRSALIIGLQGIRARKTRTLLSMVSLFLGVLAVVVVQAGADIVRQAQIADVELQVGKDGTREIYLPASAQDSTKDSTAIALDALKGRPHVVSLFTQTATVGEAGVTSLNPGAQPLSQIGLGGPPPGQLTCDASGSCVFAPTETGDQPPPGQAVDVVLTGMSGDVREFKPFRPVAGSWLDFSGAPSLSPGLVINKEAAKFFERYPMPARLHLPGAKTDPTPRIIGVIDDGQSQPTAYGRLDELLNWQQLDQLTPEFGGVSLEIMFGPGTADTEQILKARLAAGAGLDPGSLSTNTINSRERLEDQLRIMQLIFFGLAGMVLLIGVAGILNVGLATVGERVEEFALRRAVGTPRVLLAGIVLAETLFTGLFTALAAILAASQGLRVVSLVLGPREPVLQHIVFPWSAGVAGVIAGLIAGVLGGLIPAVRAARIPIATVMRA
jgi:putative ABC transport system permease protein